MSYSKINTSYQKHAILGGIIGVWLVTFLILIAPFDAGDLSFMIRVILMPLYGVISFVGYMVLIPFQNLLFKKLKKWNLYMEILFLLLFHLIVWIGSLIYYESGMINGDYGFVKFTLEVYYPIFFIILPILILARWYLNKKPASQHSKEVVLTGENKHDILKVSFSELICISSADNYVEVNYLNGEDLCKKLLRTTLKNVENQIPELLKTHRSHLINILHFKEWKDSNTLILTKLEIPISKKYKQAILTQKHSPLKPNTLSHIK